MIKANGVVMHKDKYRAIKEVNSNGVYFKDLEKGVYCEFAKFEDVTELTWEELFELSNNDELYRQLPLEVCECLSDLIVAYFSDKDNDPACGQG